MSTGRLEAFSDGVLAILITIMVLELRAPHDTSLASLRPLVPVFLSYVLSFVFLGIYWNNHHHLFQAAERVTGGVLWANLHLLFWLSLIPFTTAWMGENSFASVPLALYGVVLLMAGGAFAVLVNRLQAAHPPDSVLARAVDRDPKRTVSIIFYAAAVGLAFVQPWMAGALYVAVALMWLVPSRRVEHVLDETGGPASGPASR